MPDGSPGWCLESAADRVPLDDSVVDGAVERTDSEARYF